MIFIMCKMKFSSSITFAALISTWLYAAAGSPPSFEDDIKEDGLRAGEEFLAKVRVRRFWGDVLRHMAKGAAFAARNVAKSSAIAAQNVAKSGSVAAGNIPKSSAAAGRNVAKTGTAVAGNLAKSGAVASRNVAKSSAIAARNMARAGAAIARNENRALKESARNLKKSYLKAAKDVKGTFDRLPLDMKIQKILVLFEKRPIDPNSGKFSTPQPVTPKPTEETDDGKEEKPEKEICNATCRQWKQTMISAINDSKVAFCAAFVARKEHKCFLNEREQDRNRKEKMAALMDMSFILQKNLSEKFNHNFPNETLKIKGKKVLIRDCLKALFLNCSASRASREEKYHVYYSLRCGTQTCERSAGRFDENDKVFWDKDCSNEDKKLRQAIDDVFKGFVKTVDQITEKLEKSGSKD